MIRARPRPPSRPPALSAILSAFDRARARWLEIYLGDGDRRSERLEAFGETMRRLGRIPAGSHN